MTARAKRALEATGKLRLIWQVIASFAVVHVRLRRQPFPEAIRDLGTGGGARWTPLRPQRMSRIVHRTLRLGPWRPRCLISSLVLYRLLREQGDDAELVIGLPDQPRDKDAHAWVEIGGIDVGPPPGKGTHEELARYR